MDALPIWAVLLFTVSVVLVAIEMGFQAGQWRSRSRAFDSEAQLSAMTGAHLALLAFIMAFSFSLAAGHYTERKRLLLAEANSIETTYLRAGLIQHEEGQNIARLLESYTALRAEMATTVVSDLAQALTRSEEIHEQLWAEARKIAAYDNPNVLDSLLIQSINQLFDLHNERVAAGLRSRVPPSIWIVVAMLLILSMTGIGYFSGVKGNRNPVASTGLALSFSLVLFLIADLDRPISGMVKTDHSAMLELNQRLNGPAER